MTRQRVHPSKEARPRLAVLQGGGALVEEASRYFLALSLPCLVRLLQIESTVYLRFGFWRCYHGSAQQGICCGKQPQGLI